MINISLESDIYLSLYATAKDYGLTPEQFIRLFLIYRQDWELPEEYLQIAARKILDSQKQ
jgi:hypothetical protein